MKLVALFELRRAENMQHAFWSYKFKDVSRFAGQSCERGNNRSVGLVVTPDFLYRRAYWKFKVCHAGTGAKKAGFAIIAVESLTQMSQISTSFATRLLISSRARDSGVPQKLQMGSCSGRSFGVAVGRVVITMFLSGCQVVLGRRRQ